MPKYIFQPKEIDKRQEAQEYIDILGGGFSRDEIDLVLGLLSKAFAKRDVYDIVMGNQIVGCVEVQTKSEGAVELGIEILESYQRQGHGYCALIEMMRRLCETKAVSRFEYIVQKTNVASIALVEKLGGALIEEKDLAGEVLCTYHIQPNKGA